MRTSTIGIAAALLVLQGCASATYYSAAQEIRPKSRYGAIEYLAKCLEVDPAHQEAITLLHELCSEINIEHGQIINDLERAKKYDQAVAQCDRVIALRSWVQSLPGDVDILHEGAERTRLADSAAEEAYKEGDKYAGRDDRRAARAYRRALGFARNYKDARAKYEQSLAEAMVRVYVDAGGSNGGEMFAGDVANKLRQTVVAKNPEFMTIVDDPSQAMHVLQVTVQGNFSDTGWQLKNGTDTEGKSRVIGQKQATDFNGQPKYDAAGNPVMEDEYEYYDVHAYWTEHRRTTSASLSIAYDLKTSQGANIDSGRGQSSEVSDSKFWVDNIYGRDPTGQNQWSDALPSYVREAPNYAQEPLGFRELAQSCDISEVLEKLAQRIFQKYK